MEIYGICERYDESFRLKVKATEAMNQAWLDVLNQDDECNYKTFEEAMNDPYQCYLSNKEGFLVMEVVRDLHDHTYFIEYYFDSYEDIEAELTEEELAEIDEFIFKWRDKMPDQNEVDIWGEEEFLNALPDDIPWKKNLI